MSNDEIGQTAVPIRVDNPLTPPPLKFKPWHKPRKQYIRKRQWICETKKLLATLDARAGGLKELKYFSLPGEDLLDIRLFADLCKSKTKDLYYLGFEEDERIFNGGRLRQNISQFSNGQHSAVNTESNVENASFCDLADETSEAYKKFRQYGPFHVLNVDACDSLAESNNLMSRKRLIDGLKGLIDIQINNCNHDWLLFITARTIFEDTTFDKITKPISENASQYPDFGTETQKILGIGGQDLNQSLMHVRSMRETAEYTRATSLGLCKWVLHLIDKRPNWHIKLNSAYDYTVHNGPDMVSLALTFKHTEPPTQDFFKIAPSRDVMPISPPHKGQAIQLAQGIQAMKDVDVELANNPTIQNECMEETIDLLRAADYDVGKNGEKYKEALSKEREKSIRGI